MAIDGGLRSTFRTRLPKFMWTSIESPFTSKGIPDAEFAFDGYSAWVEFKLAKGKQLNIKPEQIGWHIRRDRQKCPSFIAVRNHKPGIDQLLIYYGYQIEALDSFGIDLKPQLVTNGGASRWNWSDVSETLLSGWRGELI